ncbi:GFA family protein [Vibrio algarum]|uniref:GFA family protein n=1 Tax=Vibrio algarum TaxID=3020714 RepID=A0ABT4YXE7_9VIBR|nr:GFA family protein [Vibrio sp. KJ40-1]MDB1126030.1 GFA family protein [Vibrio sp. KJ40-1]
MTVIRTASCSCNLVTIRCKGDPIRTSICHCFECQKRTGSVFGVQARYLAENTIIDGDVISYSRIADSGNQVTYDFCPRCGTTMRLRLTSAPEAIIIPLGLFKEQDFSTPTFSVYEERKRGWIKFDCEMDHFI